MAAFATTGLLQVCLSTPLLLEIAKRKRKETPFHPKRTGVCTLGTSLRVAATALSAVATAVAAAAGRGHRHSST